ncbi:hypothetical protein K3495_g830 [Podosphaera aphanis]|nr:hypothetical protein K3495_g830 [Podosphaera aphanis]
MENDKGESVDLYVPRKCSATNRIIKAKDHASVQISIAKVDERGHITGENQVYALSGFHSAMVYLRTCGVEAGIDKFISIRPWALEWSLQGQSLNLNLPTTLDQPEHKNPSLQMV